MKASFERCDGMRSTHWWHEQVRATHLSSPRSGGASFGSSCSALRPRAPSVQSFTRCDRRSLVALTRRSSAFCTSAVPSTYGWRHIM